MKVLNLPLDVEFDNQLPIKILSIVTYQFCWQSVTINQILLNESIDHLLCHMYVRAGFYLFSEVVDGHQDKFMPVASLWVDQSTY